MNLASSVKKILRGMTSSSTQRDKNHLQMLTCGTKFSGDIGCSLWGGCGCSCWLCRICQTVLWSTLSLCVICQVLFIASSSIAWSTASSNSGVWHHVEHNSRSCCLWMYQSLRPTGKPWYRGRVTVSGTVGNAPHTVYEYPPIEPSFAIQ